MKESICSCLEGLGFIIEHKWERVIHAMQKQENGLMLSVMVDVEDQTFSLKGSTDLIEQSIIKRQGFDTEDDLRSVLLKNRVFTRYHPDSG